MIVLTILLVIVTGRLEQRQKLSARTRDIIRIAWIVALIAASFAAIRFAGVLLKRDPNINPFIPGAFRLFAIIEYCEAYFVSSLIWMRRAFNLLERGNAELFIAVRQLRSRKSGFLTVISFLAFLGVGLSSFGLCFTISIMGGFGNDLKHKILGNNAHVVVDRERQPFGDWRPVLDRIRTVPGIVSATPLVQGEIMITSQTNLAGVVLRGIDPQTSGAVEGLRNELVRGRLAYLLQPERLLSLDARERRPVTAREADPTPLPPADPEDINGPGAPINARLPGTTAADVLPGIIVGRELATNLHLAVGDEVRVVSPFGGMVTPAGPLPKTRLFRVAGVFYSGMYEYDTKYAYVTMPAAQDFFNFHGDQISSIEIRVRDVDSAPGIAAAIKPLVANARLNVRDWVELNQNLFRALKLEKLMMFVLLGVAIVVASFAIVATLLLLVMEKGREIAVLKAMGSSDSFVARVFVYVGLLIGAVGSTLGVSTAFLVCSLIKRLGIPLDPEVYYIDRLPVFISVSDYMFVTFIAVLICLVATMYPAWAASRLRPVDGMRFG